MKKQVENKTKCIEELQQEVSTFSEVLNTENMAFWSCSSAVLLWCDFFRHTYVIHNISFLILPLRELKDHLWNHLTCKIILTFVKCNYSNKKFNKLFLFSFSMWHHWSMTPYLYIHLIRKESCIWTNCQQLYCKTIQVCISFYDICTFFCEQHFPRVKFSNHLLRINRSQHLLFLNSITQEYIYLYISYIEQKETLETLCVLVFVPYSTPSFLKIWLLK